MTSDPFNAALAASVLVGTWRYPAPGEPGGICYLHLSDDGRVFQFVYDLQKPERRMQMRLWYSVESSTELRLRPKGDAVGWLRKYRLEGATLTVLSLKHTFVCSRVPPEEIPDWFRDALAKALLRP